MSPSELIDYLTKLIQNSIPISTMIWGAPGIGKSSIVASVARQAKMGFIDIRLSQLAPTDLRGLPVPEAPSTDNELGISKWYPPEFLPTKGKGILFLDELNMAPPAMQGVAQQLILDRQVGSYKLPDGWFIFAAGNRKEDHASVFDMPAPLANRFLHLCVEVNFECFRKYALEHNFSEEVIAFLGYRPKLLHQLQYEESAWPSPRTWEMASSLFKASLPVNPAIGDAAASEFKTYLKIYKKLPDLNAILNGKGEKIAFPKEVSRRWATATGLTSRSKTPLQVKEAFHWLIHKTTSEWIQLYATDVINQFKKRKKLVDLAGVLVNDESIGMYIKQYEEILST
ncbi:MoxR family ATPase [Prochlorococcus sp. MIT 1341]|uniref:ATP-binding protein n=1 Tax=Prochlorococcus sp. MIT 1341 TaxID=3096221 RepID=UPI002A74F3EE|nr:MoxR family ATPase [Prochlorococcus sp. MIT 1341]